MQRDEGRRGWTGLLSVTGWLAVALGAAGAVLLVVGWWAIAGESSTALQLPYLASASIPGGALVVAAAALLSGESARRSTADSARMVATLFELLTAASVPVAESSVAEEAGSLLMVSGGNRYHRPGCVLVEGKAGVTAVDAAAIRLHDLRPCPICSPLPTDG